MAACPDVISGKAVELKRMRAAEEVQGCAGDAGRPDASALWTSRPAGRRAGGAGWSCWPRSAAGASRWRSRSGKGVDDVHQAHAAGWTTRAVVGGDGVDGDDRGIDGDRRGREICHGRGDEFGSGLIAERFHGGAEQAVVADFGESLGQDVLEEPRDEGRCFQSAVLGLARAPVAEAERAEPSRPGSGTE